MSRKNIIKNLASISFCLLILTSVTGTKNTLTWFIDETGNVTNTFDIGVLDLEMYCNEESGFTELVTEDTVLFDREALYEPGFTQVVKLKVVNKGTVPFDYKISVKPNINSIIQAISVKGNIIKLPDYLKFGVVKANTLYGLDNQIGTAEQAKQCAVYTLGDYSESNPYIEGNNLSLDPKETNFIAIVLSMPELVGNEANYRGDIPPEVELGICVIATQQRK